MNNEELIAFRDAYHIPNDVPEELLEGIKDIVGRIPRGWGRWLSVEPGWYKIICDLNRKLAELDPGYEVHQVKEKFGGLRYYFGMTYVPEPACCQAFDVEHPMPKRSSWRVDDPKADEYREASDKWHTEIDIHHATEEHITQMEVREPLVNAQNELFHQMLALADEAEDLADKTCEVCGETGALRASNFGLGGWLKTLCLACAQNHSYGLTEVELG